MMKEIGASLKNAIAQWLERSISDRLVVSSSPLCNLVALNLRLFLKNKTWRIFRQTRGI